MVQLINNCDQFTITGNNFDETFHGRKEWNKNVNEYYNGRRNSLKVDFKVSSELT